MPNLPEIPAHLTPAACYVCGGTEEQHGTAGHAYWSNAQAAQDFTNEPQADADVEARYITEHRPY